MDSSRDLGSTLLESTQAFAALADVTRLRILGVLGSGPRCVCDLRAEVDVPANLLSYHLRILRDAGLVTAQRRGRWVDYQLEGDALARIGKAVLTASEAAAGVAS
jgi:ArsR family transcriptional regulator, arsenate/arsenite/antimonite-responsive transcriptional repressor